MDTFKNAYIPTAATIQADSAAGREVCRMKTPLNSEPKRPVTGSCRRKKLDPTIIDYLYFGITIAQHHFFYGHTWSGAILTDDQKHLPGLLSSTRPLFSTSHDESPRLAGWPSITVPLTWPSA